MAEGTDVQLVRGPSQARWIVRRRIDAAVTHLDRAIVRLSDSQGEECDYDYGYHQGVSRAVRSMEEVKDSLRDLRRTTYVNPEAQIKVEESAAQLAEWKADLLRHHFETVDQAEGV